MAEPVNPSEPPSQEKTAPSRARIWLSRGVDIALWAAVAGVLALAIAPKNSGPGVGTEATPHELALVGSSTGHRTVTIPGKLERPLLIEAFASWCGACRRNAGVLSDLAPAQKAGKLDVLAVSVDDDAADALVAKNEWPIEVDVAHDATGQFARDYRVDVLPTYILVGVDGKVKRVTAGVPGAGDIRAWLHAEGD